MGNKLISHGFKLLKTDSKIMDVGGNDNINKFFLNDAIDGLKAIGPLCYQLFECKNPEDFQIYMNEVKQGMKDSHTLFESFGYVAQKPK